MSSLILGSFLKANRFHLDSIEARGPIWKQESYATDEVEWTRPCRNYRPVPPRLKFRRYKLFRDQLSILRD